MFNKKTIKDIDVKGKKVEQTPNIQNLNSRAGETRGRSRSKKASDNLEGALAH